MGDIGIEIAKRRRAFGMTIVYHQRTLDMPAALGNIRRYFKHGQADGIVNPQ